MLKHLLKIKIYLSRNKIGRIIISLYHYTVSIPLLWIFSIKYLLVKKNIIKPIFYENDYLIKEMKDNKKSLSRFGDGEVSWIFEESKGSFNQENSKLLSDRLREVIQSNKDEIIIAIPNFFEDRLSNYSLKRRISRNAHLSTTYRKWGEIINPQKLYGDALITRAYLGLNNIDSQKIFNDWKSVWFERNVIIVEGDQTRFGVGNNLLNNVKSLTRVIAPSENAFSKYSEIFEAAIKASNRSDDVLYLISLGPTASILAYDLALSGYQAIDIGHLDIEFEWYLMNAKNKISIIGKYVNEAGGGYKQEFPEEILKKYNKEILIKV